MLKTGIQACIVKIYNKSGVELYKFFASLHK